MRPTMMFILFCLAAVVSVSAEPSQGSERPNLIAMSEEEATLLPPMLQQIRSALIVGRVEQAAIEAEREASEDPMELRDLDKRLSQSRETVEITIYRIQADFARREGRDVDAVHFQQLVANMKKPAVIEEVSAVAPRQEVSR